MGIKINYGSDQASEYNRPNGDQFNGQSGTMTGAAVTNRANQPPARTGNDPYQNFKDSARSWGQSPYTSPSAYRPSTPADPGAATALTNVLQGGGAYSPNQTSNFSHPAMLTNVLQSNSTLQQDNPDTGGGNSGGGNTTSGGGSSTDTGGNAGGYLPGGHKPAPITPPAPPPNGNGTTGGIDSLGTGMSPNNAVNPRTGLPYAVAPPAGVDPHLWNDVDFYAREANRYGANYQALYQHPEWVSDFRNWVGQDQAGRSGVRIEDWLEANHHELTGLRGHSGADTYAAWTAAHPANTNTGGGTAQDVVNQWRKDHGLPPLPAGGATPPAPNLPPAPPNPAAPDNTPPPTPTDPSAWHDATMPNVPSMDAYAAQLRSLYDPSYKLAQNDLAALLRGQAALTGDSNAGGEADVLGRQEGRLMAQQNADFGDKLQTGYENEKNRALDRYKTDVGANTAHYQIDVNKFSAMLDADTKKYGIKTNADMQKYLGDQSSALQKYGIDTNALLDEYKAQLQLKGQMYSVDGQLDQAALQAAAQKYGIDINRLNQQDANNLGWGQANVQRYGIDKDFQARMVAALQASGLTPAEIAQIVNGLTPTNAYQPANNSTGGG